MRIGRPEVADHALHPRAAVRLGRARGDQRHRVPRAVVAAHEQVRRRPPRCHPSWRGSGPRGAPPGSARRRRAAGRAARAAPAVRASARAAGSRTAARPPRRARRATRTGSPAPQTAHPASVPSSERSVERRSSSGRLTATAIGICLRRHEGELAASACGRTPRLTRPPGPRTTPRMAETLEVHWHPDVLAHDTGSGPVRCRRTPAGWRCRRLHAENAERVRNMESALRDGPYRRPPALARRAARDGRGGRLAARRRTTSRTSARAATTGRVFTRTTLVAPGSWPAVLAAAGTAIGACDAVLDGDAAFAYALVRPPGHHASSRTADGYCFFNNTALAARERAPPRRRAASRSSTGTSTTATARRRCSTSATTCSRSRGTWRTAAGAPSHPETGSPDGGRHRAPAQGYNVNVELPLGSGDHAYLTTFDEIVEPIVTAFDPDLIIVASGQDANQYDPNGRQCVTMAGFRGARRSGRGRSPTGTPAASCCSSRRAATRARTRRPACSATVGGVLGLRRRPRGPARVPARPARRTRPPRSTTSAPSRRATGRCSDDRDDRRARRRRRRGGGALRRRQPGQPRPPRRARALDAGRQHAHRDPRGAVPAHDREGLRRDDHRRRRPRLHRLPRRVHGGPVRPLAPDHPRRRARGAGRRHLPRRARTSTRRASPPRSASGSRRSTSSGSPTPAPRRTCSPSRWRASTPGARAIMVFEGGYHGGVFFYATAAGSPINAPFPTVMGQYNDAEGAARLIAEHAGTLAAVVVEPLQGSAGCIPAEQGFLEALRERHRRARRAADLRRGDDVAAVARRAAARDRGHAGPDVARQVRRRRPHVRRLRRPRRPDGAVRPDAARTHCRTPARSTTTC